MCIINIPIGWIPIPIKFAIGQIRNRLIKIKAPIGWVYFSVTFHWFLEI